MRRLVRPDRPRPRKPRKRRLTDEDTAMPEIDPDTLIIGPGDEAVTLQSNNP